MKKIIDAARYAPSGMNFQPWEFIVVRGKDKIQEIINIKENNRNIYRFIKKCIKKTIGIKKTLGRDIKLAQNADVLIIAMGDTRKFIILPRQGYKFIRINCI